MDQKSSRSLANCRGVAVTTNFPVAPKNLTYLLNPGKVAPKPAQRRQLVYKSLLLTRKNRDLWCFRGERVGHSAKILITSTFGLGGQAVSQNQALA